MAAVAYLRVGQRVVAVHHHRLCSLRCSRNYSAMSGLLIEDPKYSWLKELGLSAQNDGVYTGTWGATGDVSSELFLLLTLTGRHVGMFCSSQARRLAIVGYGVLYTLISKFLCGSENVWFYASRRRNQNCW